MTSLNCVYHEERESVKQCSACSKPLCEDCVHADFADYCWSCGYEHEQKQIEEAKSLVYPAFLEHKVVYYVLHQAFSAFGASFISTLMSLLVLSMLAGPEAIIMAFYIGLFTLVITSTYGVICSMLIDTIAHFSRFVWKRSIQGALYLIGGLLFPYLSDMSNDSELLFYLILSGGTALLFFILQTTRLDKRLIISVGILSLFVIALVNCNFLFLIIDVLF